MGLMDRLRGFRRGAIGIELGRTVAAAQIAGDTPAVRASGQSGHAGLQGAAMGGWLKQWLSTIGNNATSAHAVIVDEEVYHYLVTMPTMSSSERHLAAGAEVRKLAPVPAGQLAYSQVAVGAVEEDGVAKDRVLISAVEQSAVRRATDVLDAAGLETAVITTVPSALIKANEFLPPVAGGTAIAYLSAGRSYLLVFQDGVLELVRDFVLRSDDRDFDPAAMTELITSELRRSFLYFGQRAQGATVDRLVLTGPMANLTDVAARLREGLGIAVELFDVSGEMDLGMADRFDQPALAVAIGAATMSVADGDSMIAPEEVSERRTQRAVWIGMWAAAAVLVVLLGLAAWAWVNGSLNDRRLSDAQTRVTARQTELRDAQSRVRERSNHAVRVQLLEQRALESTLVGAMLQRVGQRVPEPLALETLSLRPVAGPGGSSYWNMEMQGLVFGATRSESQAIFNRFYALLASDPLVEAAHLTANLQVGNAAARQGIEFEAPASTGAVRSTPARRGVDRDGRLVTDNWPTVGRNPWLALLPNEGRGLYGGSGWAGAGTRRSSAPTSADVRTTLDDLPPFAATATSVGFTVLLELKAIAPGGAR
jgi:Tfp pilus assembly PilM family ATPase/Tfp pilus assembly protein PilN